VLWLFVLVPMLISKRDAVRRTSDVALATRVLNGTTNGWLRKRGGPASGHRSDPGWRPPEEDDLEDTFDEDDYDDSENDSENDSEDEHEEAQGEMRKSAVLAAPEVREIDPDNLDVDEPSGALPVGESAIDEEGLATTDALTLNFEEAEAEEENVDTAVYEIATDEYEDAETAGTADEYEYEYVEDSAGLEAPDESGPAVADTAVAARRRRYDPAKAAAISARKYKFRKRMLACMTLVTLGSAAAAHFLVAPWAWYACGGTGAVTLLYLLYLRRQTRIEERVRRRRAQRSARARLGVANTEDPDLLPSRLRRPGSVVLEIDDEDPIFEHLEYAPSAREYHLPRAAGQ
jgi:hypothetical protein